MEEENLNFKLSIQIEDDYYILKTRDTKYDFGYQVFNEQNYSYDSELSELITSRKYQIEFLLVSNLQEGNLVRNVNILFLRLNDFLDSLQLVVGKKCYLTQQDEEGISISTQHLQNLRDLQLLYEDTRPDQQNFNLLQCIQELNPGLNTKVKSFALRYYMVYGAVNIIEQISLLQNFVNLERIYMWFMGGISQLFTEQLIKLKEIRYIKLYFGKRCLQTEDLEELMSGVIQCKNLSELDFSSNEYNDINYHFIINSLKKQKIINLKLEITSDIFSSQGIYQAVKDCREKAIRDLKNLVSLTIN